MPFRFDKFTVKAQEAVQAAVELAANRGNPQVTPVHLIQALLAEREGIVRPLLGSWRPRFRISPRCRGAPSRSRIRN
jgi:ATP-dependent Clp protease ATP-binding subunit ClpA